MKLLFIVPAIALVMFIPARNSILSTYGYTQPWGYDTLRPWIQANLPGDAIVAAHPFDKSNLAIKNKTTEYSHDGAYSVAEHMENKATYVVADLNWTSAPFYDWMFYGFDEVRELWNKPLDILGNTYFGIAAQELFRYQVHTVSKPWQSPDTHFVIARIPQWPEVSMHSLKEFTFDRDDGGWKVYGVKDQDSERFKFDPQVGKSSPGSIAATHLSVRFPIGRVTSQPIPVKENHLYKIGAFVKTDRKLESKEREGFIRVDFYGDNPNLEKLGIRTDVSSRIYGTNDWIEKKIIDVAPKGAKYMTVSAAIGTGKIWVDDVVIQESDDVVSDPTAGEPYTKDFIDPNYLYPNSHGNL